MAEAPTRVLVTGAAGFLGSTLCRALASASYETHGTLRANGSRWRLAGLPPSVALHEVDLTDFDATRRLVERVRPELVYHTAAQATTERAGAVRTALAVNAGTLANLLDATVELELRRFVHLASSMELAPSPRPHREEDALEPVSLRGATKAAGTLLALQQAREHGRPIVALRPFSIYGPWEPPERMVPTAIRAILCGEELALTPPGVRRDFVLVDDVVEACLLAAGADGIDGEAINVASGRETANEELVAILERLLGRPARLRAEPFPLRATDRAHWRADVSKARRLLGWEARHDLEAGLAKTIEWTRSRSMESVR